MKKEQIDIKSPTEALLIYLSRQMNDQQKQLLLAKVKETVIKVH